MRPKPIILNATVGDQCNVLNNAIERPGIPFLPNVPANGSVDGGLLITSASRDPHVLEARESSGVEVLVEETPNFMGLGA